MTETKTQTVLVDKSMTGRERPWEKHKVANEYLSAAYEDVDPNKAERLKLCATDLVFQYKEADGGTHSKLVGAWFCRVRLCPVCTWRRSLKVAAQMHKIMGAIKADRKIAYILVTLTVRNCLPEDLDQTITQVLQGFNLLTRYAEVKRATLGFYRSMEITHNVEQDTYHPHIHAIFAVKPEYFKGRYYIKQDRWVELWQRAAKLNYSPSVDVRKIKGDTAKAVAEVAKYAVKSEDYILPDDWDMTVDAVRLLNRVLHNRRFIAFGGIFKDYHKKLNLQDAEKGDLVNIDDDPLTEDSKDEGRLVRFAWFSGYRQYRQED